LRADLKLAEEGREKPAGMKETGEKRKEREREKKRKEKPKKREEVGGRQRPSCEAGLCPSPAPNRDASDSMFPFYSPDDLILEESRKRYARKRNEGTKKDRSSLLCSYFPVPPWEQKAFVQALAPSRRLGSKEASRTLLRCCGD